MNFAAIYLTIGVLCAITYFLLFREWTDRRATTIESCWVGLFWPSVVVTTLWELACVVRESLSRRGQR